MTATIIIYLVGFYWIVCGVVAYEVFWRTDDLWIQNDPVKMVVERAFCAVFGGIMVPFNCLGMFVGFLRGRLSRRAQK